MHLLKGLLLMLGLFAFSNSNAQSAQSVKASFNNVDVEAFEKMMADDNVIVIDVRTPQEVAQGTIKGAINANVFENFNQKIALLDKSKTYLVYCRSGRRSVKASNMMLDAGFTKVNNLLGGYRAWSNK